jgi:hypothetical protein
MTRRPVGSRSFLRQMAEPIPRAVAPLVSRGPGTGRGATAPSALDLIPPILEVNETAPDNRNTTRSFTPPTTRQGEPRTATSSLASTLQPNVGGAASARRHRETESSTAGSTQTVEPVPQSSPHESPPAYQLRSTQENVRFQSTTLHSFAENLPSQPNRAITQPQVIASQPEYISGTRVHIGTIEVRVPAPPTPNPQPAVKTTKAGRGYDAPGRSAEPLARGLAWSHGLVQG